MRRSRSALAAASAAIMAGGLVVAGAGAASADSVDYPPYRVVTARGEVWGEPIGLASRADGTLYLAGSRPGADVVWIIGPNADGSRTPRRIAGPRANFGRITDVGVDDAGQVYVLSASGRVAVFARGAHGDVAPIRTFQVASDWPGTMAVSRSGEVAVEGLGDVKVYAAGATGTPNPARVLAGPRTGIGAVGPMAFDPAGRLWMIASGVRVIGFAPGAAGDVAPSHVLTAFTMHAELTDLAVDRRGRVYVSQFFVAPELSKVWLSVFRAGAHDERPLRELGARRSGLAKRPVRQLTVDGRGDLAYATGGKQIRVFRTLFPVRPTAVRSVTVSGKPGAAKRTVRWKKPSYDGGRDVRSYKLVFRKGSKTLKTVTLKQGRRSYRVAKSGLRRGKVTVTVRAKTAKGWSPKVVKSFRVR
ncbi:hypothetical protein [Mumia sp. DW29H23]|uniref:hypothetical protein n=1 Tax=Mumia sp. DW29H23 TaxID=3421241 RepID=UPI003D6903D2